MKRIWGVLFLLVLVVGALAAQRNVGCHLGVSYYFRWDEVMIFAMAEPSFGWDLGG